MKESTRVFYFVLYTVLYEGLIWGVFLYLIVAQDWNEWTIIVAIMMSGAQFKPRHFGITVREKSPHEMDDEEFERYEKSKKLELKIAQAKEK